MALRPTFTMVVAEELLEHAARLKVDIQPFRERLRLSATEPPQVEHRIPAAMLLQLWEELPRASGADDFGLSFAASIAGPTSNLGTLLVASSGTLGEGLARFLANERAFNELLPTQLEHDGTQASLVIDPTQAVVELPISRHAVEAVLAWWWMMICRSVSTPLVARRVEWVHPAPASTAAYRHVFGIAPQFERPRNVLTFDAEVLRRPLATRSTQLRLVAERATQQMMQSVSAEDEDPVARIREQIVRTLEQGETLSQSAVARSLGVSARTLQRMLGSSQTTFTALADEVRCTEAQRLLHETRLPIQDVARRLGYYDAGGFFRAFKRWTGMTPGDFRRQASPPDSTSPDASP